MKTILYESEIFAADAAGGIAPFQIIVQKTSDNGREKVEVFRKEYKTEYILGADGSDGFVPVDKEVMKPLSMNMWRDKKIDTPIDDALFGVIKKYVDKYDFLDLLGGSCPDNEYDIESRTISEIITKESTVEEIEMVAIQVFKQSFSLEESGLPERKLFKIFAVEVKEALDEL